MAKAIVTEIRGAAKGVPGTFAAIAKAYFFGNDVSEEVEGQPYDVSCTIDNPFTIATLRQAITSALQAQGSSLGFNVLSTDILEASVTRPSSIIANVELTENQPTIVIPEISQRYRDLEVFFNGRSDVLATYTDLLCRLNENSGAIYDSELMYGVGGITGAGEAFAGTSFFVGYCAGALAPANVAGFLRFTLHDYAQSVWEKMILGAWGGKQTLASLGLVTGVYSGWWRNTAPITHLTLTPAAGQFIAGTRVTVVGIS